MVSTAALARGGGEDVSATRAEHGDQGPHRLSFRVLIARTAIIVLGIRFTKLRWDE